MATDAAPAAHLDPAVVNTDTNVHKGLGRVLHRVLFPQYTPAEQAAMDDLRARMDTEPTPQTGNVDD